MLHTPVYDTKARAFCGPTAIAAVTGTPISKVHKMVRRLRADKEREWRGRVLNGGRVKDLLGRRMPVKGMHNRELVEIMRRLGFKVKHARWPVPGRRTETLQAFCEDRGHMGPFIVNVTGHYVAVSHGMICDTLKRTPVPFAEYPKLRSRVKAFWHF